jgi:hypothetical protein
MLWAIWLSLCSIYNQNGVAITSFETNTAVMADCWEWVEDSILSLTGSFVISRYQSPCWKSIKKFVLRFNYGRWTSDFFLQPWQIRVAIARHWKTTSDESNNSREMSRSDSLDWKLGFMRTSRTIKAQEWTSNHFRADRLNSLIRFEKQFIWMSNRMDNAIRVAGQRIWLRWNTSEMPGLSLACDFFSENSTSWARLSPLVQNKSISITKSTT